MSRFTLSSLFSPWAAASTPPAKAGWYRVRTEPLTYSWWNCMAYFDGTAWWEFGMHAQLSVRREVRVLQWQGLQLPFAQAAEHIRANLPRSASARRRYERFLASFEAAA